MTSLFELPNHSIIAYVEINPVTRTTYIGRLEWGGPAEEPALVSKEFWEEFEPMISSYWTVDVYESQNLRSYRDVLLVRQDQGYTYCYYRYLEDWFRLIDWLRMIHRRLIMTAMVWGLAWIPNGAIPGNQHLFKQPPY